MRSVYFLSIIGVWCLLGCNRPESTIQDCCSGVQSNNSLSVDTCEHIVFAADSVLETLESNVRNFTTEQLLSKLNIDRVLTIDSNVIGNDSPSPFTIIVNINPDMSFLEKFSTGYIPDPTVSEIPYYFANEISISIIKAINGGILRHGNIDSENTKLMVKVFIDENKELTLSINPNKLELYEKTKLKHLINRCHDIEFGLAEYNDKIICCY